MPDNPYESPQEVGSPNPRRLAIPPWLNWLVVALIVVVLIAWWLTAPPYYPPGHRE